MISTIVINMLIMKNSGYVKVRAADFNRLFLTRPHIPFVDLISECGGKIFFLKHLGK